MVNIIDDTPIDFNVREVEKSSCCIPKNCMFLNVSVLYEDDQRWDGTLYSYLSLGGVQCG